MEERARILKMLEEGKINVQEAEKLLDSTDKKMQVVHHGVVAKASGSSARKGKHLKIKVESKEENENVNISIPLSLAKVVLGFIPKNKAIEIESAGVNLGSILEHIEDLEALDEDIVNVDSGDEKVRIYIE